MNYRRLVSIPLVAAALLFSVADLYSVPVITTQQTTSEKSIQFYYACPMHPDVHYQKPGKCPKCKMTLEKKQVQPPAATNPDQ